MEKQSDIQSGLDDNRPVTLAEAAKLFFGGRLTKSSLRTEARNGNLEIMRIAGKDFVTKAAIVAMMDRCKLPARVEPTVAPELGITGQEAVRVRLKQLKSAPTKFRTQK